MLKRLSLLLLLCLASTFARATAPIITTIAPTSAVVGTVITITGTNLDKVTAVIFNGIAAKTITDNTATSLKVTVPEGATSGKLAVTTAGGTVANAYDFAVPFGVKTNPIDGAEMVLIPAGEFLMGTNEEQVAAWIKIHPEEVREPLANEVPQHKVELDAYYMYKTEVTVAQYRKFCTATGIELTGSPYIGEWEDDHPIVNIKWEDAKAYADWAGVKLPTEAQWEKAVRGGDGRIYFWGNNWPPPAKFGNFDWNDGYEDTAPVASFTPNPYGIYDLAGNVWEWCTDWYGGKYEAAPVKNPTGPKVGEDHVMRGGSWYGYDQYFRCAYRATPEISGCPYSQGFRCVSTVPGK